MTTHYVRVTGSNANNGSTPALAWATVAYAVASGGLAAGDTVWVGAGVYRQTMAPAYSGSAGSPISIIGDVDGKNTGDAGQVVCTAYTTSDTAAPSGTVLLALAAHTNLSFSLITFIGGNASIVTNTAATAAANYTFTDCVFGALFYSGAVPLSFVSSTTGLALGITIDRCVVVAPTNQSGSGTIAFSLATTASGSADYDALCVVRNTLIIQASNAYCISVTASGTATYNGGGVRIYGCTVFGYHGIGVSTATYLSTTVPCEVHNNVVMASHTGIGVGTAGQLTGSYNVIYAGTPTSNYTYGTGDVSNSAGTATYEAPLLELGQSYKWAGVIRQFMAPDTGSPLLSAGSATFTGNYPTVDWANRPRPSGGKSASASVGYAELHDFAIQDTVVYPSGQTSSAKLIGPGDNDIWVPVDAVSTTIAIQLYQGSGYTGTTYASATLEANGELGTAAQILTCTSTLSAWQTLTFSAITASKSGWVKVRISSFDTSGTGTLNFGALTAV